MKYVETNYISILDKLKHMDFYPYKKMRATKQKCKGHNQLDCLSVAQNSNLKQTEKQR